MSGYGAAPLNLNITRDFCAFLAGLRPGTMPAAVFHAGKRGVLDWLGCALAGSGHRTVSILVDTLQAASEGRAATVLGRSLRLGLLEAPLANGLMGHVLDYDDTHMQGVILHASSPILSALLALADRGGADGGRVDGASLLTAYAAGFEAGVRVGQTAPRHHAGGWHLTGTLGTLAAGAATGALLRLEAGAMTHALGTAATQAAGMQQNRGTMCKSFHAGKAAQGGLLAGLLAQRGFTSSDEIVEGKKGFCRIYSSVSEPERLLEGLGERWEIARNGYKPYACGVVQHPLIDAMIELGRTCPAPAEAVTSIELRVHPGVIAITGVADPETGLKSKFSLSHSAAVAFLDRAAGIAQYADSRAAAPEVALLRGRVKVEGDESFRADQAEATVVIGDRRCTARVEHATGTVDNPMSDAAIEAKFLANAVPTIGEERAGRLRELVWRLDSVPDLRELTALLVPSG